jgi:plastocyanin
MNARRTVSSAFAVWFGALLLAACFTERTPTGGQLGDCLVSGGIPFTDSLHYVVVQRDFAFHPQELRVPRGATVTWVNCERAAAAHELHTTTSDDDLWDSGPLQVGQLFSFRFDDPGDFDYVCLPHPFMRGTVQVE